MAPPIIPGVTAQYFSAIYNPLKDSVLYWNNRRREINDLENRIRQLISTLNQILSKKEMVDRHLEMSVWLEKTSEYHNAEENISYILKQCTELVDKFTKIIDNQATSTTELVASSDPTITENQASSATELVASSETTITGNQASSATELVAPTLNSMIDELTKLESMVTEIKNFKSRKHPRRFLKLAKCSRDIAKHITLASGVRDRFNNENMTMEKYKPSQEKFSDSQILPVFDKYANSVEDYLHQKGKAIVGIAGPVGVGKTSVLKKLCNRISSQYEHVIFINYPEEMEAREKIAENLRNQIIDCLTIRKKATMNKHMNASSISETLGKKKYLLLVDDVSGHIEFDDIGVREHHENMHVVIASRDKKVVNGMVHYMIEIDELNADDAMTLFENICGEINGGKREIAERLIECCGRIPGYIILVAKHLKDHDQERSWNAAVDSIKSQPMSRKFIGLAGIDGMYKEIYEKLDSLSKKCILYGALFPILHNIHIDYLIECWIAEGFIDASAQGLSGSRKLGFLVLGMFKEKYLLKRGSGETYVKMEPNFRTVAFELDYPDDEKKFIISVSPKVQQLDQRYRNAGTRMSFFDSDSESPTIPKGSNIHTLLLQKANLNTLHEDFFNDMQSLQVLDLYKTGIVKLPESIKVLLSLKSLYLNGCTSLAELPAEAAHLLKLEFLDIRSTKMSSLPEQIGSMVALRCLRASLTLKAYDTNSKGKEVDEPMLIIPPNIIEKLEKLEELVLDLGPVNNPKWAELAESLVPELATLKYLTTIVFNFPNLSSLEKFVTHSKATFTSFKITIGCQEAQHTYASEFSKNQAQRWLRYNSEGEELSAACKELLKQVTDFEIIGNDGVETLSQFDLPTVTVCVVGRCNSMKSIVSGNPFPNFEKLYMYDLPLLECIATDHSQKFMNLTTITIDGCPKLTKILSLASAHDFKRLEYLKVENCSAVSEIVEVSEHTDISRIPTSLRKIELSNLPELQTICKSTSISWNSLNSVSVTRCGKLRNLSLTSTNAPSLASIHGEQSWWDNLESKEKLPFHPRKEDGASTSGTADASHGEGIIELNSSMELPAALPTLGASTSGTADANHGEEIIELDSSMKLPAALPTLGASTNGAVAAHYEEMITPDNKTVTDPLPPSKRKPRTGFPSCISFCQNLPKEEEKLLQHIVESNNKS